MTPVRRTSRLSLALASFLAVTNINSASASTVQLAVPSTPLSHNIVQDNFAGISLEFNVLDHIFGPNPDAIPAPIVNYLSNIRSRISNPLRIRIGGNSLDGSTYNQSAQNMITFKYTTGNGPANIPVTYGRQLLTTLAALSDKVGGMTSLVGLSMNDTNNESDVIQFAQDAQSVLGTGLDAILIGNEPDLYAQNTRRPKSYNIPTYTNELNKVYNDLQHGSVNSLYGYPTICCRQLKDVLQSTMASPISSRQKYATLQHYPRSNCDDVGRKGWDLSYFTNHATVRDLVAWQQDGIAMARAAGKEIVLDEFNTVSCGGWPGRSNTFAATLWTIDYELGLAAGNYSAAFVHTREPGVTYNLFTYPDVNVSTASNLNSGWTTGVQYPSLLFLADAFSTLKSGSGSGSIVADLNIANTTQLAGYVLYGVADPTTQPAARALVLINFSTASTTFTLPAGIAKSIRVRLLAAPSLTESSSANIKYAGQSVVDDGLVSGELDEQVMRCPSSGCAVDVSGPGAALVFLQ